GLSEAFQQVAGQLEARGHDHRVELPGLGRAIARVAGDYHPVGLGQDQRLEPARFHAITVFLRRPACTFSPMAQMSGARSAAAGLSAAALILLAACAHLGGSAPGGGFTPGGTVSSASPSSPDNPQKALLTAAVAAQRITSAVETIHVSYAGAAGRAGTGTIRFRLKPAVRVSENLRTTVNGRSTRSQANHPPQALCLHR